MDKFLEKYNILMESILFHKHFDSIPRPDRFKTPPNNYGNTGHNARYFDRYVQDEAEDIFIDKYGDEKGHRLWEGIIYKGNAMWTACDEILGELRTMIDLNYAFIYNNEDLKAACTDWKPNKESWIYQWTIWILTEMISGKQFTHNFISTCIPTFKYFAETFPKTFTALLTAAGIPDVNNYQLSKKIQAKVDAEAEAKRKAEEEAEAARKLAEQKRLEKEATLQRNKDLIEQYGSKLGNQWSSYFKNHPNQALDTWFDLSVGIDNIMNLPEPTNKDEQRIYDIVRKGGGMLNPNIMKMNNLAYDMNNKITDEKKRAARRAAAEKYGLTFLAEKFR